MAPQAVMSAVARFAAPARLCPPDLLEGTGVPPRAPLQHRAQRP